MLKDEIIKELSDFEIIIEDGKLKDWWHRNAYNKIGNDILKRMI